MISRTRIIAAAAALPSLLSLIWTVWSVADMIPAPWPVGVAAGALLDLALVGAVVIAWHVPTMARGASLMGWAAATLAAVALAVHGWQIAPGVALLAVAPLVSKGLWQVATGARRAEEIEEMAQERRRARMSGELTDDDREEAAEVRRQAARVREMADARRELADAEQSARLEEIDRRTAEEIALEEATTRVEIRRAELARERRMVASAESPMPALTSASQDATGAPAGFGSAIVAAATTPPVVSHQIDTDLRSDAEQEPRPVDVAPAVAARRERGRSTRERVRGFLAQQPDARTADVARAVGVSPSTARRHMAQIRTEQQ